jgi:hypothetical protein
VSAYSDVGAERPRTVRDHTQTWERLRRIGDAPDSVRAELARFCESRRITLEALEQLGTRVTRRRDTGLCLAYAGTNGNGVVVAIKYRPINGSSHDSVAEPPSVWLRPIVIGNTSSLDWLVAEGETDAARLYELVGDRCAILALPAGARTFRKEWADLIPRGATVALCHDADEDGDAGAETAARIIGGRTVRVRPPVDGGDWCDWDGDREAFLRLAKPQSEKPTIVTLEDFIGVEEPGAAALLGSDDDALIPEGGDIMLYGDGGAGKTTLAVDLSFHLGAGADWHGIAVPRPVRVLLIENEGPRPMFRRKLKNKSTAWTGGELGGRVQVFETPWGEFSLDAERWREQLALSVDAHEIDVVVAGPLTRIGMNAAGTLQEVIAFMRLVADVRRRCDRPLTVVLIHHENKGGKVSGAWEGSGDTLVHVQSGGNGHTIVFFQKARWAPEHHRKTLKLAWAAGEGFEVEALERDYKAVVVELRGDRRWLTIAEIAAPTTDDPPGIGAGEKTVKAIVEGDPDLFESRTGDAARALGRSPNAVLWSLRSASNGVDRDTLFSTAPSGDEGMSPSPSALRRRRPTEGDRAGGASLRWGANGDRVSADDREAAREEDR